MLEMPRAERWAPWAVFILGILLLLPSIWSESSVTGGDEYMFTLPTPMEMRERGEWITPWLNGEPRLRKPPLVYWAIRVSYEIFGVSLFAGRLIGVLAGAGLAAASALLAREMFGRHALLAGLLALSTMGISIEGRRAMLDLPVATLAAFSVLHFVRWGKQGRLRDIAVSAGLLGMGVLTKGPVALLFVGAAVVAWLLVFRKSMDWRGRWAQIALSAAVFLAITLPWPLAMYWQWSQKLSAILQEELADRQFGAMRAGSPLSAWTGAVGLVFPWSLMMLAAIWTWFRAPDEPARRERAWLILWFTLSALPFFFMKAFERYMLALVPGQAALVAAWICSGTWEKRRKLFAVSATLLCLVALAVGAFAWWFRLGVWQPIFAAALAVVTAVGAFRDHSPHRTALRVAGVFAVVLGLVYPLLGVAALPKNLPMAGQLPARKFQSNQPAMLSSRLGYSVREFDPARMKSDEIVFVESVRADAFEQAMANAKLAAQELIRFKTFYSRKAWVRFARADATREDWRAAFRARSLDDLRSEFRCYLVSAP